MDGITVLAFDDEPRRLQAVMRGLAAYRCIPHEGADAGAVAAAVAGHEAAAVVAGWRDADGANEAAIGSVAEAAAGRPLVVVTADASDTFVRAAVVAGADDVVAEAELETPRLARAVLAALLRRRTREDASDRGYEREYASLQRWAAEPRGTALTRRLYSGTGLQRSEEFPDMAAAYANVVARSCEQEAFAGIGDTDVLVRQLAERLGHMGAGPRDVVELHTRALRRRLDGARDGVAVHAFMDEARYVLVQLLGSLVSFYRARVHGGPSGSGEGVSG